MPNKADFFLAQYLRDPMRREPKNVGLIVLKNDECVGRFLGEETAAGDVDLRTVPWAREPKIYRKWVRFWREELAKGEGNLKDRLTESNGGNFDVIMAGGVTDINGDTARTVCDYLFPMLVGSAEQAATEVEEEEVDRPKSELRKEITGEFKSLGILGGKVHDPVPNPIWPGQPVVGKRATHRPSYQQLADVKHVMEVVNFTTRLKAPAKDHAGWAAKMFDDIRNRDKTVKSVALVRATKEDREDKVVKYALALLEDSAQSLVFWNDPDQRRKFLEARREAAFAISP